MRPTPTNLDGLLHKTFILGPGLIIQPAFEGVKECGYNVVLAVDEVNKCVELKKGEADDSGLWVPYSEGKAVVGYATGATTWAASGPFSGCEFSVGAKKNGTNTTIAFYAAHIARQSGSTGVEDWQRYYKDNKLSAWYHNKIPLPSDSFFACSYLFTEFGLTGLTTMVRLDVKVNKMGGSDGEIFHVKRFK